MESCKRYFVDRRRISYEYALIDGVNDSPQDAEKLSQLLAGQTCHINLILVNPVKNKRFRRPAQEKAAAFERILKENGFSATIRRRLGEEIDAACGQLRANEVKEEHE
jgi:23S rRNA (adenine2503-C2)-methyltransferase